MVYLLAAWTVLFLVFTGAGLLVIRLFGRRIGSAGDLLLSFWLGWAAALFALQIWNLWRKVDGWSLVLLSAAALAGIAWNGRDLIGLIRRSLKKYPWVYLLLFLAGIWLANRASGLIGPYDAGLYHLQLVKWFSTYPLIPGLGNLHSRFAFNSAYFLYAAMLDVGPGWQKSHHLANSLLVLLVFAQILYSFTRLFSGPDRMRPVYFFTTLFLAPLLTWVYSEYYTSISPDLPIFCLGIILAWQLFSFLLGNGKNQDRFALFSITALACAGIIIKLSFAVVGILSVLAALVVWLYRGKGRTHRHKGRTLLWIAGCAVLSLLPWLYRGVLLSGYPVYPSMLGAFGVPWRLPGYIALNDEKWIQGWARNPDLHWGNVLYTRDWIQPWLDRLPVEIAQPVTLALVSVFLVALFAILRKPGMLGKRLWAFFLPPLISILVWFYEAPDARFAGAAFWVLAAGLIVLAVEKAGWTTRTLPASRTGKPGIPLTPLLVGLLVFLFVNPLQTPVWMGPFKSKDGLAPLPPVHFDKQMTDSGLQVNIPVNSEQCWAAPLPCAPVFNPGLRLIQDSDIRQGFIQDFGPPPAPKGFSLPPGLSLQTIMGWNSYDDQTGILWARPPSRLLIYTEQDLAARLSLVPEQIYSNGELRSEGTLTLRLDRSETLEVPIQAGVPLEIPLHLHAGFNALTFVLSGGNQPVESVQSGSTEKPPDGIGFRSFEIKADNLQEGLMP